MLGSCGRKACVSWIFWTQYIASTGSTLSALRTRRVSLSRHENGMSTVAWGFSTTYEPHKRHYQVQEAESAYGRVHCLCELRDKRIVSGSDDASICFYDRASNHVEEATAVLPTQLQNKSVLCLALLLDGKLVSGSRDCNIKIWHPASGRFVTTRCGLLRYGPPSAISDVVPK